MISLSNETENKIKKFADEQTQNYLENSEMTYIEKLRKKSSQTKNRISAKMAKFKARSEKGEEIRDDMVLYMSDYINDLISQGISEQDALEKAKSEMILVNQSEAVQTKDLQERIKDYYENKSPEAYETEGLIYGGFSVIGVITGGITGYILGGGRLEFLSGGWIDLLIGIGCGAVLGVGVAMIINAIVFNKPKARH